MARGRLSDSRLAELGRKRKDAMAKADKYEKRKKSLGDKIVAELRTRRTKGLTTGGVRITRTIQKRTEYDYFGLQNDLVEQMGRKEARKIMNLIRPKTVDASALLSLMAAGEIDPGIVERNSRVVVHADYPTITLVEETPED